jgi:hypothetical protein
MEPQQVQITIEEFYQVVGELEILRRKQNQQLQSLFNQINEMQAEIEKLREANGRLVETNNNIELRDLRGRGQEP